MGHKKQKAKDKKILKMKKQIKKLEEQYYKNLVQTLYNPPKPKTITAYDIYNPDNKYFNNGFLGGMFSK